MSTSEDREWDAHWDRVEEDQARHEWAHVVYAGRGRYNILDGDGNKVGERDSYDAAQLVADDLNDPGDDMEAEQQVRY